MSTAPNGSGCNLREKLLKLKLHVPFPKEGVVGAPTNAPGSISSSTTNTTSITETSGSGADSISLLSTTLIIGTSTTDSTQAAQNMSMADIALTCALF